MPLELEKISAELQKVHDFGDELGAALAKTFNGDGVVGGGWTHRSGHAHYVTVDLVHPSGLGVWLRHQGGYRKGRNGRMLTVGATYPRGYSGRRAEEIRVWMDRDRTDMARDIIRRLLPDYLATIDRALKEARKADLKRRARILMNGLLEKTLPGVTGTGGTPACESRDRRRSYWSGGRFSRTRRPALASGRSPRDGGHHQDQEPKVKPALVSGHATLSDDATTMDLELKEVPAELALKILAMVNPAPALEGTIVPREVAPAVPALLAAQRVVQGQVVSEAAEVTGSTAT
ncbi:hypothetical protein ACFYZ8_34285 [Streptomyces sp. NPDC001668]|uniref:hypothetical protein n=1 Tax=Streptomyces sp. NPDC001668 TaxID=3364598 RepID=UPI0036A66C39